MTIFFIARHYFLYRKRCFRVFFPCDASRVSFRRTAGGCDGGAGRHGQNPLPPPSEPRRHGQPRALVPEPHVQALPQVGFVCSTTAGLIAATDWPLTRTLTVLGLGSMALSGPVRYFRRQNRTEGAYCYFLQCNYLNVFSPLFS